MEEIIIPSKISLKEEGENNEATITIEPCYSGYGITLGNAMRRVLLSSLSGAAVTAVRIKGVDHEFSTIPSVKEDLIQIISNLKSLRFKMHSEKPARLKLQSKGKKIVTAAEFEQTSEVEVVNSDLKIAEITSDDAEIDMEVIVEQGRGYVPVEQRSDEDLEIGMIAIDSVFTPVLSVGYEVDNIRVGKRTDYDQLIMKIKTDGTVTPLEALVKASNILIKQFEVFSDVKKVEDIIKEGERKEELKEEQEEEKDEEEEVSVSELNFSTRTFNALDKAKIRNIKDLSEKSQDELLKLPGFGQTALDEVQKALKKYNLELKN